MAEAFSRGQQPLESWNVLFLRSAHSIFSEMAWKSSSVAEGYIEDSINNKIEVADRILKTRTITSSSTSAGEASTSAGDALNKALLQPLITDCSNCNITINITNN